MGYTNKELQRRIDERNCGWSFRELERRKKLEEQEPIVYKSNNPITPIMIVIDGVKNSIMNLHGGVKEFVKDYGGDYFDEERVEWFVKNEDYNQPKVLDFIDDWNVCFPE